MIEKIFSKAQYSLIILGIILIYFLQEKRVLNFPMLINVVLFAIAFTSILYLSYRYDKRIKRCIVEKEKEIKKNEDINIFSAPIFNLLKIALLSLAILCSIKYPMLRYIEYSAQENPMKVKKAPINDVKLRNNSTIYIELEGEIESLKGLKKTKKKLSREKLIENYVVRLEYKESIFGTIVLDRYKVIRKQI